MQQAVVEIQPMSIVQVRNFFSLKIDIEIDIESDYHKELLGRQLEWIKSNYLFLNSLFTLPNQHYTNSIRTLGNRPSSIHAVFHSVLSRIRLDTSDTGFKDRFIRLCREFIDLFIATDPILIALEYRLQRALVRPNAIPPFPEDIPETLGIHYKYSRLYSEYLNIVASNNMIMNQFQTRNGYMVYNGVRAPPGRPSMEEFLNIDREIYYGDYTEEFTGECSICCEQITPIEKQSCGHRIHVECIVKSKNTTCPVCRQEVALSTKELTEIFNLKYNGYDY
jgi:hypothetical protein